jgi:hypothetical protein
MIHTYDLDTKDRRISDYQELFHYFRLIYFAPLNTFAAESSSNELYYILNLFITVGSFELTIQ